MTAYSHMPQSRKNTCLQHHHHWNMVNKNGQTAMAHSNVFRLKKSVNHDRIFSYATVEKKIPVCSITTNETWSTKVAKQQWHMQICPGLSDVSLEIKLKRSWNSGNHDCLLSNYIVEKKIFVWSNVGNDMWRKKWKAAMACKYCQVRHRECLSHNGKPKTIKER